MSLDGAVQLRLMAVALVDVTARLVGVPTSSFVTVTVSVASS